MNFVNSLITCYKKFFSYSGRASRSEYWWISLMIVPIFNLYILYLLTTEGSKDENRFGVKPEK